MFIITWSAQNCEYEWEYTSEIFYWGANNCVQCVFEKNIYLIMIFPPILNSYYPMKGKDFVIKKDQKD